MMIEIPSLVFETNDITMKETKKAGMLVVSQNWSTTRNTLRMPNSLVSHGLS